MIDVLILNRNLGEVCDSLVRDLESRLCSRDTITVIDAGSVDGQESLYTKVRVDDSYTKEHGLRFGRGMNLGLKYRSDNGLSNPWVLMLPVDSEIIFWDVDRLIAQASAVNELVAIKPMGSQSPYAQLIEQTSLKLAWNVDEGPWLIRSSFIEEQLKMSAQGNFFSHDNFRGYLTSLDLAFRAYANGYCLGITSHLVIHENESYLLNRSDLIRTEPLDLNRRLLVSEGLKWLENSYAIGDPWSFAQVVRLLYERFLEENPSYQNMGIEAIQDED